MSVATISENRLSYVLKLPPNFEFLLSSLYVRTYLAIPLDDAQLVELPGERLVDLAEEEVLLHLAQPLRGALALLLAHQEVNPADARAVREELEDEHPAEVAAPARDEDVAAAEELDDLGPGLQLVRVFLDDDVVFIVVRIVLGVVLLARFRPVHLHR